MKNVTLDNFFLRNDKGDDFFQAEQTSEENDTAVDGKGDDETEYPIDIQLFDEEGGQSDGGKKNDDMKPITSSDFQLQDAFGKEVLQKGRDGLYAEAGAGGTHSEETRDDNQVKQDVDDHASPCHKVELFEATVGGE